MRDRLYAEINATVNVKIRFLRILIRRALWRSVNYPMQYNRGQSVLVEDFEGKKVPLRVWEDTGEVVLVTSSEVFSLLEKGGCELHPIGVPKSDVSALPAGAARRI